MIYFWRQEMSLIRCIGFVIAIAEYAFRNGEMDEQIVNGYRYIIAVIDIRLSLFLFYTSRLILITFFYRLAYTALYSHCINVILGATALFANHV